MKPRNEYGAETVRTHPAWLSQKRRRADSNRCSGRDDQSRTERSWHHGAPLFLAIVALAAAPLFNRTLGQFAVGVLFALMLWTALRVNRKPGWVAPPERRGVKP